MNHEDIRQAVQSREADLIALRRHFHQHPEIAFEEVETAALVAKRLTGAGLEVRTGIAKTGVVAVLRGGRPGHTVLIRADMDALPVQETNQVEYGSRHPGAMHA